MGVELRIEKEMFTPISYQHLLMYSSKTQYLQNLNAYEVELYQGFDLIWFLQEEEVVGYALMKEVKGEFFYRVDDHEEIVEVTNNEEVYTYLAYFEILRSKQDAGYGTFYLELLREQYPCPIIVYTTEDSVGFWLNKGFKEANYSDWWLTSEELPQSIPYDVAN